MSSKNISLKKEAYKRLITLKKPKESFSDEIIRLTEKNTGSCLTGFLGLWKNMSKEEKECFEEGVKISRAGMSKLLKKWENENSS